MHNPNWSYTSMGLVYIWYQLKFTLFTSQFQFESNPAQHRAMWHLQSLVVVLIPYPHQRKQCTHCNAMFCIHVERSKNITTLIIDARYATELSFHSFHWSGFITKDVLNTHYHKVNLHTQRILQNTWTDQMQDFWMSCTKCNTASEVDIPPDLALLCFDYVLVVECYITRSSNLITNT